MRADCLKHSAHQTTVEHASVTIEADPTSVWTFDAIDIELDGAACHLRLISEE